MAEPNLFTVASDTSRQARKSDPLTSHEAKSKSRLRWVCIELYATMKNIGMPANDQELEAHLNKSLAQGPIDMTVTGQSVRMARLLMQELGLIRQQGYRPTLRNKRARAWVLTGRTLNRDGTLGPEVAEVRPVSG